MDSENKPEENISPVVAEQKKGSALNISSAIIVAAVLIAGAIFVTRGGAAPTADAEKSGDKLDLIAEVSSDDFVRGNPNAEITIVEYADFSCHYCGQYHPELIKLVNEFDGKVKWVYRHLPIFNMEAAVAGQCVGKVGGDEAFWKFADTMFANTDKYSTDFYEQTAIASGADKSAYESCIADPLIKNKIQQDFNQEKILLGFNATPYTVLIDKAGRKFSFAGALPYEDLKTTIESLLK